MTTTELRKRIIKGLNIVDRRTLKIINAILWETLAPDDGVEEKELFAELKKRSKANRTGKSKSLTVEELRAVYQTRKKKRETSLKKHDMVVPLSKKDEAELARRIKEYEAGKGKSYTLTEAKEELRRRISKK